MAGTGGGSTSGAGTTGSGGNGGGNYPRDVYFAADCSGQWKGIPSTPYDYQGSFTLTGNVPVPIPYDYDTPAGYAGYVSDKYGVLHIQAESQGCYGPKDTCKICHYIYDGEIASTANIVYNRSAGPGQLWTVWLSDTMIGSGIWHTISYQQTDSSCPESLDESSGPILLIGPATEGCFNAGKGFGARSPFTFADGSAITVSSHSTYNSIEYTHLDPRWVFHIGRAPT
jgi:hypothetical protein